MDISKDGPAVSPIENINTQRDLTKKNPNNQGFKRYLAAAQAVEPEKKVFEPGPAAEYIPHIGPIQTSDEQKSGETN
jgi:hypothetical protein